VDKRQLATDADNIGHFDLRRGGARRVHGEVGGTKAEQPVPEQVVPVPLEHHSANIKNFFPLADCLAHAQPATREDDIRQPVEHEKHEQPEHEQDQGDGQVGYQ